MTVVPDFAASENLLELKRMNADKLLLAEHTHAYMSYGLSPFRVTR